MVVARKMDLLDGGCVKTEMDKRHRRKKSKKISWKLINLAGIRHRCCYKQNFREHINSTRTKKKNERMTRDRSNTTRVIEVQVQYVFSFIVSIVMFMFLFSFHASSFVPPSRFSRCERARAHAAVVLFTL